MAHDYDTRKKKYGNALSHDDLLTNAKLEENINTRLSSLRDESLNLNDIVIKRLQIKILVFKVSVDINVDVDYIALEACHRFSKPERTIKSRKTIGLQIRSAPRKIYLTKKILANLYNKKHHCPVAIRFLLVKTYYGSMKKLHPRLKN